MLMLLAVNMIVDNYGSDTEREGETILLCVSVCVC